MGCVIRSVTIGLVGVAAVCVGCLASAAAQVPAGAWFTPGVVDQPLFFQLPAELYRGAEIKFPNAAGMREFSYSPAGSVRVYFYDRPEVAAKDMQALVGRCVKVAAERSAALASRLAGAAESGGSMRLWFNLDTDNLEITMPQDKVTAADLITAGEAIVQSYEREVADKFSTPERCVATFLRAAAMSDVTGMLACVAAPASPESAQGLPCRLALVKAMVEHGWLGGVGNGVSLPSVMIGTVTHDSETAARVVLVRVTDADAAGEVFADPFVLAAWTTGREDADGERLVPVVQAGARWGVDFGSLMGTVTEDTRSKARRVADATNLKQIGLALRMYSGDFGGAFPDNLGTVADQMYPLPPVAKVFVSPGSATPPPQNGNDIRAGRCDYLYFGAGLTEATCGASVPMAMSKPGLLGGSFVNVLYGDGQVKGCAVPPPEVQKLLEAQKKP